MPTSWFDQPADRQRDSNPFFLLPMIRLLHQRLRELSLHRQHRAVLRKVAVIEGMGLPEDLKLAAISCVMRQFEEDAGSIHSRSIEEKTLLHLNDKDY